MATTTYGTPYVQSSDLVSAYPGTSSTLATRVDDVSLKGNGLNDLTGTSYTLVLTDGGKTVTLSNASAVTVTIPTNTSVAFPTGTIIRFVNKGAGAVTIQPTAGVTLNGGNLTLAQFAAIQVVKLATDTWGQFDSVGTPAGLTLLTPSSIANSGGSASVSGSAVTFTTVTSVSVNGVFSATYDNYRLEMSSSQSVNTNLLFRWRSSGSDRTGAVYGYAVFFGASSSTSGFDTAGVDQTSAGIQIPPASQNSYLGADIFSPFAAGSTSAINLQGTRLTGAGTGVVANFGSVLYRTADSNDGFTLSVASGTLTGTLRVYGYRN